MLEGARVVLKRLVPLLHDYFTQWGLVNKGPATLKSKFYPTHLFETFKTKPLQQQYFLTALSFRFSF